MITIKPKIEEIELEAISKLTKQVSEFGNRIIDGTTSSDNFMTMNDIEYNWKNLRNETEKVYTEMVSQIIAAVDERDIIRKKKESTETEE